MSSPLKRAATFLLPRVAAGHVLATSELRTLERVAETLLDGAPIGVSASHVARNVEDFLIRGRSRRAWRVRVLLTVIELAPIATHRRVFSALSAAERVTLVQTRWASGRHIWRICAKVRNLVVLGAYGDPRAAATTGYVPVPLRPRFRFPMAAEPPSEVA